jgi:colanic acid biosynthesis glycosyl transferase WcaI
MRIQIWSYNYHPEPQGIGPLSTVMAEELAARGHDVLVVTAYPHYPHNAWGTRWRPSRERRHGVAILRLPLWIGRETAAERVRQEVSFTLAESAAAPVLPACDVMVGVSPSFPALAPCMAASRLRRTPWVLWLQDLVTDAAASTGLLPSGPLLAAARRLELAAYASAARIVAISESFRGNLVRKGVPDAKIVRIFNSMTVQLDGAAPRREVGSPPRLINMGNIGRSQGLDRIVDAFERSSALADHDARLVIAGHGVEAAAVRARVRSERVTLTGVLDAESLDRELRQAALGVVSQRPDVVEFNLPSKLMNYMAYGLPVLASVRPDSETARIVHHSGAGWVADTNDPDAFADTAARLLDDPAALERASAAARAFALSHFHPRTVAERFEQVLLEAVNRSRVPSSALL